MSNRKVAFLIKWSVSIGLIVWILRRVDLDAALRVATEANMLMIGVTLIVMACGMLVRAYKWQILLKVQGACVPLSTLLNLTLISMFFNNLFLGSLGGDAFRFYRVIGYTDTKGGAASSVIMERLTGFFMALLMVFVFGITIILNNGDLVSAPMLIVVLATAGIAGLFMGLLLSLNWFVDHFPLLRRIPRITEMVREFTKSMRTYVRNPKVIVIAFALSALFQVIKTLTVYCFALSVNANVSFMVLLFIAPLVGVLAVIPISMNGLGIQEGSYIFFLEQIGVSAPRALLVALLSRMAVLFFSLLGGVVFAIQSQRRQRANVQTRSGKS